MASGARHCPDRLDVSKSGEGHRAPNLQPVSALTGQTSCHALCSREEVAEVYNTPLLELVYRAASVHRMYNDPSMVR